MQVDGVGSLIQVLVKGACVKMAGAAVLAVGAMW